jgi:hypothetical protein
MRGVFIVVFYVAAGCIMPGEATADQAEPIVETVDGYITVKASNVSLSNFLKEVSLRTSIQISAVDGGDVPVTVDGRFSSLEQLLEQVCEGLAVVYERREDGGFRIVKAEAYSRAPDTASETRPLYRPGQLLVQFKPDVEAAEIEALHAATGSRVLRVIHDSRMHQIALPEGADMSAAIKAYRGKGWEQLLEIPIGNCTERPEIFRAMGA